MTSERAETIRAFVLAGHGDLTTVQRMLSDDPTLLQEAHEWAPGDTESAIQAAAHVGNRPIAEFLLLQGAPLEICTAAMLGQHEEVERRLSEDATQIEATGAHRIPLLAHAALSGNAALVGTLLARGAAGHSMALGHAAMLGHLEVARAILKQGQPDLSWQNWQGKTALAMAEERGDTALAALLRARGGRG